MTKWEYDFDWILPRDRRSQLKKMGEQGWELVTVDYNFDLAHAQTYYFKRPVEEKSSMVRDTEADVDDSKQFLSKQLLHLIVRVEDQYRVLSLMSKAGWYIKDVTKDRKVDGAYVTYVFTKRAEGKTGEKEG
jgi:hypothetical protein